MATFLISIIGIYFTASLALVVLFVPKFYNLWKANHGDDDDDGSFVIRDHGQLGQPVLRGVTDIRQAARMAGVNGSVGDNLGCGTFGRSLDNLHATLSTQPTSAARS